MRKLSRELDRLILDQTALVWALDEVIVSIEAKRSLRSRTAQVLDQEIERLGREKRSLQNELLEAAQKFRGFDSAHKDLLKTMQTSEPGIVDMERVNDALENLKRQRDKARDMVIELGKKIKAKEREIRRKQKQRRRPSPRPMFA